MANREAKRTTASPAITNLLRIFTLGGISSMLLSTRSPDLEKSLNVSNGLYGTLVSAGTIGSLIALFTMGKLVPRFGVIRTLRLSSISLCGSIAIVPHIHSPWIFLALAIITAGSYSAYHIAMHTQAFALQEQQDELLLPRMHGGWSTGVLISTCLTLLIGGHSTFSWEIDTAMVLVWLVMQYEIRRLIPMLVTPKPTAVAPEPLHPRDFLKAFNFQRLCVLMFVFGVGVEQATYDWSILLAHQEYRVRASVSDLTFFSSVLGIIIGRRTFHHLTKIRSEKYWIRLGGFAGGFAFIIFTQGAHLISHSHRIMGFVMLILGFGIAGLGGSFAAPMAATIANRRSGLPSSQVVAMLGIATNTLMFLSRNIVSWVAQATSISIALWIPGLFLIAFGLMSALGSD
jgi:MFS family permease